jgi:hypothetical protein
MKSIPFSTMVVVLMLGLFSIAHSSNFALQFDGQSDYVLCGTNNLPLGNSPRTIEAWFKTESPEGYLHVAGYGTGGVVNSALAIFTKGGSLVITQWGAATEAAVGLNDGQWHHTAVTHDGKSTQTMYLDGEFVGNWDRTLETVAAVFTIGANLLLDGQFFVGTIDEVRIWNVQKTQEEIKAGMNQALSGGEPYLVGYWNFDEGKDNTAYDFTASGNDGEIVGPVWIESDVVMIGASLVDAVDKLAYTWGKIKVSE